MFAAQSGHSRRPHRRTSKLHISANLPRHTNTGNLPCWRNTAGIPKAAARHLHAPQRCRTGYPLLPTASLRGVGDGCHQQRTATGGTAPVPPARCLLQHRSMANANKTAHHSRRRFSAQFPPPPNNPQPHRAAHEPRTSRRTAISLLLRTECCMAEPWQADPHEDWY